MQNFSHLIQGEHFQIGGWIEGERKFKEKLTISRKRWNIGPITNRKWHTPFQMKWKSSILDNLEGHWQPVRLAILATSGLLVVKDCSVRSSARHCRSYRLRRRSVRVYTALLSLYVAGHASSKPVQADLSFKTRIQNTRTVLAADKIELSWR